MNEENQKNRQADHLTRIRNGERETLSDIFGVVDWRRTFIRLGLRLGILAAALLGLVLWHA